MKRNRKDKNKKLRVERQVVRKLVDLRRRELDQAAGGTDRPTSHGCFGETGHQFNH